MTLTESGLSPVIFVSGRIVAKEQVVNGCVTSLLNTLRLLMLFSDWTVALKKCLGTLTPL